MSTQHWCKERHSLRDLAVLLILLKYQKQKEEETDGDVEEATKKHARPYVDQLQGRTYYWVGRKRIQRHNLIDNL